jgi:hypothetical protein
MLLLAGGFIPQGIDSHLVAGRNGELLTFRKFTGEFANAILSLQSDRGPTFRNGYDDAVSERRVG